MKINKVAIILVGLLIFLVSNADIAKACYAGTVGCTVGGLAIYPLKNPTFAFFNYRCSCFIDCLSTTSGGQCGTKGKCCWKGETGTCPTIDRVDWSKYEGEQVWLAWGLYCYEDGCRNDLIWDPQDGAVKCDGVTEVEKDNCDAQVISPARCESVCGAHVTCDEKEPDELLPPMCPDPIYGQYEDTMIIHRRCSDTCSYSEYHEICDATVCGKDAQCFNGFTDNHRYCVYDSTHGWYWTMSPPSNFCCADSDCEAKSPRPTCESQGRPNRYAECETDYTCTKCDPCEFNLDCEENYCCVDDPDGPTPGTGQCTSDGKGIYTSEPIFLCDPGEWMMCDSGSLDSEYTFNDNTYTCVQEDEEYKWIVSSETVQHTVGLPELVIQFFQRLFSLLVLR